ncbi:MAG: glycosyltransferase family 4 protein [Chloroflexota bacterium]|nr:MAG: undecaprenyl/decaprenyl-phosphate alpha-N-acetylglucosaminyl 1-phosphate transferase [Chloroflexota bacterium]
MLTPLARVIAVRTGDIDKPVGMKIHRRPTPLMGGVAVFAAFALACVLTIQHSGPVIGVLVGGAVAVAVGIADEFFDLSPGVHLLGQIVAAVAALLGGVRAISSVSLPFARLTAPGWHLPLAVGVVVTVIWLVGMMNTVNFLDGLDGLAPGIAAISALCLAGWAWEDQRFLVPVAPHHEDLLLPMALVGALIGFLPFNWHPARIFLGDSGSMFLGMALGTLSIVGPAKLATALLFLLIPVLDVAWAIVRRRLRGKSFLTGDKQHVYHRMLELGMSHSSTVLLLYGICAALSVLDVLLYKQWKLLAFVVLAAITASLFIYLEIRATRASQVTRVDGSRAPAAPQE